MSQTPAMCPSKSAPRSGSSFGLAVDIGISPFSFRMTFIQFGSTWLAGSGAVRALEHSTGASSEFLGLPCEEAENGIFKSRRFMRLRGYFVTLLDARDMRAVLQPLAWQKTVS